MRGMKKYTMADIAVEAGVAKSTVSRYFNGGYVKEDTRRKIQEIIDRTGYEPSLAAQNLRLKHTKTIGVVAPTLTSTVTGRQLMAIDETLRNEGYSCIIINTNHDAAREIAAIESLRSLRTDGIILIATNISEEHQRLQKSSEVPFLVMGQAFAHGTSVVYDDYDAGYEVGSYARKMGHSDVIYIGVSEDDDAVGKKRKQGVLDGLQASDPGTVVLEETTFSYVDTRGLARSILDQRIPTMFICATDQMALAVYKEVVERGLKVPQDVSIIGFGGYESSDLLDPSLTSVRFHNEEAGKICARTIIDMVNQEPVARLQVISHDFRIGGSVRDLMEKNADESAAGPAQDDSADLNQTNLTAAKQKNEN